MAPFGSWSFVVQPYVVRSCVVSDRSVPEDAVWTAETAAGVALVVADGAGGMGGGARAATRVVEGVQAELGGREVPSAAKLCARMLRLDTQLQRDTDAGESTAVVVVIAGEEVVGACVGDSEAWIVGPSGDRAVLTGDQRKPRLGSGRADPVAFRGSLRGVLLVATDGLFHAAQAKEICAVLGQEPAPEALVDLARGRSGRLYDDVGLVLVSRG